MKKVVFSIFFFLTFILLTEDNSYALELRGEAIPSYETNKIVMNESIGSSTKPVVLGRGATSESIDLYNEKDTVVEVFNHSNKSICLTRDDIHLMSQVVYAESKGEPYEGKVAVASVILNRVVNPKFPNTIEGVIKQKNAFSCVKNGIISVKPDESSYMAVMDAIKGKDPSNDALFFYNPKSATCGWMQKVQKKNVKNIGRHVFFQV